MKRRTYFRALVALASITALGLVLVSSAAAAGKPLIQNMKQEGIPTLNEVAFSGEINPNGAATTYQVEYWQEAGTKFLTEPVSVGSGTSYATVSRAIRGLYPNQESWFSLKATNSYGTTTGATLHTATGLWISPFKNEGKTPKWPSPYASSGTFTIEVPSWGETVTCVDSSSGTIGAYSTQIDYNLTLSKCALAGFPSCKVTVPGPINLGSNFFSTKGVLMMVEFGETNCGGAFSMSLAPQEPFKLTMPPRYTMALSQPMSYTANTKFGTHAVILTDTSNWTLTGSGSGYTFGWQ